MPDFRYVEEGYGETLPIYDKTTPLIGTYGCITCAGVYFRVDESRCFFAHINASSCETIPDCNAVTEIGGKDIIAQVSRRLYGFVLKDKWDIRNEEFGKHLAILCPTMNSSLWEGQKFASPGKFVVRAIQDFFHTCGRIVDHEVNERTNFHDPKEPTGSKGKTVAHIDAETMRLGQKAKFLHQQSATPVNTEHHAMLVNPLTGEVSTRGKVHGGSVVREEDLGEFKASRVRLSLPIWIFVVEEADRSAIPSSFLSDPTRRQALVSAVKSGREKYKAVEASLQDILVSLNPPQLNPQADTTPQVESNQESLELSKKGKQKLKKGLADLYD